MDQKQRNNVIFREQTPMSILSKRRVVQKSNGEQWKENIFVFFPYIQSWNLQSIRATSHKKSNILRQLSVIQFPFLERLYLSDNDIQTLEIFHYMDLPLLVEVSLRNNNISCIRSLRKKDFDCLRYFWINENSINDAEKLVQTNLFNLNIFNVQYSQNCRVSLQDIRWCLKLKVRQIKTLRIFSKFRIRQEKFIQKCSRKIRTESYNIEE